MKILLTGANGYIGSRLTYSLLEKGHSIIALVRDPKRFHPPKGDITIYQGDLLHLETLKNLPKDIDAAYYLVHAMSDEPDHFAKNDRISAENFVHAITKTTCKQIIYLSGIASDPHLSKHLSSRLEVETILKSGPIPLTVLRASIIIGSGSASFEIIRDLVEKLPIMVAPKWVKQKCQPIAITDVLYYLTSVLHHPDCFEKAFEIGGPEAISYKDMLLRYAKKRDLKRFIITVPVLTPRLSSYWLIFITSTNFYLARSLIASLKNDSIKTDFSIDAIFPRKCFSYEEAIDHALQNPSDLK